MRRFLQILLVVCILALGGTLLWWYLDDSTPTGQDIVSSYRYFGTSKGFTVATGEGRDFPTRPGLTVEEQKAELDAIVAFAQENGFNAVFYEALPDQAAWYRSKHYPVHSDITAQDQLLSHFDPLEYLCKKAAANYLQVFAIAKVQDMADADAAKLVTDTVMELSKGYSTAGVLLDLTDISDPGQETVLSLLRSVRAIMKERYSGVALGLKFDGENTGVVTPELLSTLTAEDTVQMALPLLHSKVSGEEDSYTTHLNRWIKSVKGDARLYTGNLLEESDNGSFQEAEYQLFVNSLQKDVSGAVLQGYLQLAGNRQEAQMLVSFLTAPPNPMPDLTLTIPKTLAVTYPSGDVTTSESAMFLMGTSNPNEGLTMNGKEIERISQGGSFGVKVDLALGSNTFIFRQGDTAAKVTIVRNRAGGGTGLISNITKGSVFPRYDLGVDSNETIELTCVGPAGGKITASLGGMTIAMKQSSITAQNGVPAIFKGSVTLNPELYPADETKSIGKVTYTLTYGGKTTTYQSSGNVLVAGKNIRLGLEVTDYIASVLSDKDDDDTIIGTLKVGARARIAGRQTTTRSGSSTFAYKLDSGGWILADKVRVLEGTESPVTNLSQITKLEDQRSETLVFHGGTPAVITRHSGRELRLEFYGATVSADLSAVSSAFASGLHQEDISGGVALTLTLANPDEFWGFDLTYDTENSNTLLYLRRAPQRSNTPGKPLEGVTVLLDPGHGGGDPGALGVAGQTGPSESQINLAAAWAVKYRLEQLGASVSMTRVDDNTRVYLDERCIISQKLRPDVFLSIHHNSTVLNKDVNKVRRMEVYYHEAISQPLAQKLMARLPGMLGRDSSDPEESYYYVTRMTYAPAVLFELGYIVNPREYEESCDTLNLYKTACGIAQSVLDIIPAPKTTQVQTQQAESGTA